MKGIIYSIYSPSKRMMYIGSTTKKLNKRKANHIASYKKFLAGHQHYISAFDVIKNFDPIFSIVEEHNDITREKLYQIESEIINRYREENNFKLVNKNSNKSHNRAVYLKNYRLNNPEKYEKEKERQRLYYYTKVKPLKNNLNIEK